MHRNHLSENDLKGKYIINKHFVQVTKQNRALLVKHIVETHHISEDTAERRVKDDHSHLKEDDAV